MEMSPFMLTVYVLMWPVIVAGTLTVIVRAFAKEAQQAKKEDRTII